MIPTSLHNICRYTEYHLQKKQLILKKIYNTFAYCIYKNHVISVASQLSVCEITILRCLVDEKRNETYVKGNSL